MFYATILGLVFLVFLSELAVSALLMIHLAYKENHTSSIDNLVLRNKVNFDQVNEYLLNNNDISCN